MTSSEMRPRILCRCIGVASPRVVAAIREHGLRSVADVIRVTRAGSGCGTCHGEIEEILADVYGQPVAPNVRFENRLLCESETQIRVEASVENLAQPRLLAQDIHIRRLAVDGLTLILQLDREIDPALRDELSELLRAHLCRDLEVRFSV